MGTRRVLTKDDWLHEAMEVLRTEGVGGVRVLSLARSLDVTRGSFYWHFRDRSDLLSHMLDWWEREMTDSVIRFTDRATGPGHKRLLALGELLLRKNLNRYDMAIRSWAQGDRKAAAVLRRVMRKRLGYLACLFRDAGFSPAEAKARGHLIAVYLMSEGAIHIGDSLQVRLRLLRRQIRALAKPE